MPDRTDAELLAALRELLAAGRVRLELDIGRLEHPDSPVAVQAEATRWFYALAALLAAATWFGGWKGAVAALAASVAFWFGWVKRDVARRIRGRVDTLALADPVVWRKLWRRGGVVLHGADGARSAAPADNWMQFVRDHAPRTAS